MPNEQNKKMLESAFPVQPQRFDFAVRSALMEVQNMQKKHLRRTVALILALTLALMGSALAIGQSIGLFNFFDGVMDEEYLKVQKEAYELMQSDVASYDFEHVTVRIKEAVYDGEMLRVLISIKNRAATAPFAVSQEDLMNGEFEFAAADADNIRWSIMDWLYIDGKSVCPEGEAGVRCGEENGEMLQYIQTYIDRTTLGDTFTVGFPLVKNLDENGRTKRDAEGNQIEITPKELTFTLSATNLKGVQALPLPAKRDYGDYTAQVTKAIISPLRVYINVHFVAKQDKSEAMREKIEDTWFTCEVVDADGKRLLTSADSSIGVPYGDPTYETTTFFGNFLTAESYPETFYLAPMDENGAPNMDMAIEFKR